MNQHSGKEHSLTDIALGRNIITQAQVDECLDIQKRSHKLGLNLELHDILVSRGHLTTQMLEEIKELYELNISGDAFGNFSNLTPLGHGGMGKVYLAKQNYLNRAVALKILDVSSKGKESTERFYQEVRALAKLNHNNIVTIFDAGRIRIKSRDYCYFAMEYLPGRTLQQELDTIRVMAEDEARTIILDVARALEYAHSRNVIHRDVKPANIILDELANPKLTDFGVVMHKDMDHKTLTQEGMMVGSPFYCSPEQAEGSRDIDKRSDIYSLGATYYHLIAGRPVFMEGSPADILRQHAAGVWVSPRRYNRNISYRTEWIIKRMMARDRGKRYQTMEEVIDALDGKTFYARINRFFVIGVAALILFFSLELERNFRLWTRVISLISGMR